jgi:hypothetical protein
VCLNEAVRLLNMQSIRQSTDDCVPGFKNSIPGLPITEYLAEQLWAIWSIVRRWVWDADMPRALVADEMCHGKTFTLVAGATLCRLVTENVVMGLPLPIVCGNTLEE